MATADVFQVICTIPGGASSAPASQTINIPTQLGCEASSKLRTLCSDQTRRVFTDVEVVGPVGQFERGCIHGSFYDLMLHFVRWFYSSELDSRVLAEDFWHLGRTIGAPKFQNAALRCLCTDMSAEVFGLGGTFREPLTYETLLKVWNRSDFTMDMQFGYGLDHSQVYWRDKKLLLFILQCFAYFGTQDRQVVRALQEGGEIAINLTMMIEQKHLHEGELRIPTPPWAPENIDKYFILPRNDPWGFLQDHKIRILLNAQRATARVAIMHEMDVGEW